MKCIHFSRGQSCVKGFYYDEVSDVESKGRLGCWNRRPCYYRNHLRNPDDIGHCEFLEFPDSEEHKRQDEELEESRKRIIKVLEILNPIREEHKGQNWKGVIECPNCCGKLHIAHNSNGHTWGECETSGCAKWME